MFHSTCFWKLFPSVSFKLLFSLRYIWRNWKPSFFAYIARAESFKTFLQDCTFASAIRNSLFKNISLVLCFPFNRIFLRYFFHVDFLTKNLLYIDLYQIALFPHSNEIKQFPAKWQLYGVPNSNNLKPKNFLFAPYSHSDAIRKIYVKWRTCEIISLKDLESENVCTAPFSFWNKAKNCRMAIMQNSMNGEFLSNKQRTRECNPGDPRRACNQVSSPIPYTPKTLAVNGFHSLSRFRHFITEWIDSRARHEYTRAQNGNTTEH